MKFVDQVRIHVKAGDGGNGAIAFRREKYIEKGGPSGGDGGHGGAVIFEADPQLTTLLDYRYQPIHKARNGEHGQGSDCNGRGSEDLVLRVPVGTLLKDAETEELVCDLSQPGERFVAAKGGRGGLGNMNFATSTRQTPRFAQDGTPGEERDLMLELKLLADVGLLGFPNAGKSTLISVCSRAKPKIADYPFTTLVPNLGMVQYKDHLSFVMADIPGLIEGASDGAGLGLQFLRHVERCRVLIHVVDLSAHGENRDPLNDFDVLNRELARYSPELAGKPQIVVANKLDIPEAREKFDIFEEFLRERGLRVYPLSSATREGLQELMDVTAEVLFTHNTEKLHVEPPVREEKQKSRSKVKAVTSKAAAKPPSARSEVKPVKAAATRPAKPGAVKRTGAKSVAGGAAALTVTAVAKSAARGAVAAAKSAVGRAAAAAKSAARGATAAARAAGSGLAGKKKTSAASAPAKAAAKPVAAKSVSRTAVKVPLTKAKTKAPARGAAKPVPAKPAAKAKKSSVSSKKGAGAVRKA